MAKGDLLGHIDCPSCGLVAGMRITEDKSGSPFGYCEGDCDQQMRIGGNPSRVEKFYSRHPKIKRVGIANEAPAVPPGEPVAEKGWRELMGVKP